MTFLLCDPGWCVHKFDVQNEWDDNTHCVCVLSSHYSGRQSCGRTWRGHTGGRSHGRKVTREEGHTGFLHLPSAVPALMFLARRIQSFFSLVDREVEFCVLTI